MLLIGRFIVGAGIGIASNISPIYIAEVSPAHLRGRLVTINNLTITFGQFVSYALGIPLSELDEGWRYMLGAAALPALIQLFGLLFLIPESPRWLVGQGRVAEATKILLRMRSDTDADVEEEIEEIREMNQLEEEGGWLSLLSPQVRPALVVGMMMQAIQQLSGINTAMYYSASIMTFAGFSDREAIYLSTLIALANAIFTVISLFLIDSLGRRKVLLWTIPPTALFMSLLGFSFYAQENLLFGEYTYGVTSLLALESLAMYVAFFAIGLGPIPWLINAEIYPMSVRAKGNAIATTINWGCNLLLSFTFLSYAKLVTRAGTFWTLGIIGVLAWFYIFFQLPETRGKTMEEIQEHFLGRRSDKAIDGSL
eukprot:TRINITY_DN3516_c0_g1_i1.p1 TRINITY_DN3516_c0_g1~~TRINITY_DN3516_c0_g1_i1.p1  ORF type:complete len:368 (+),score=57.42 TRINITY_DN3516_c0_g1_i1:405-1508(+)